MGDLLRVDDLVAVDEGQVGLWRDVRLPAKTLKVLCALLRHQVLNAGSVFKFGYHILCVSKD